MSNSDALLGRSIALVSGKGGSGKTIVAAIAAKVLAENRVIPLVVDADLGTAGLSFYLGLELVRNTSKGISEILRRDPRGEFPPISDLLNWVQPITLSREAYFLSAGNHRKYPGDLTRDQLKTVFGRVISALRSLTRTVIVDCRGGIDDESLAVCAAVDDIILIVETDTTSLQASQYLVDVLSEHNLGEKLRGFIINKTFEDPRSIIRNGTALFRCQYLGAVPLDLDAMRDFFAGRIPRVSSVFGRHVHAALHKAYPEAIKEPEGRIFAPDEYSEVGLANLDSLRGGFVAALLILVVSGTLLMQHYELRRLVMTDFDAGFLFVLLVISGLVGSFNNTRKFLGRALDVYIKTFSRLAFRSQRD